MMLRRPICSVQCAKRYKERGHPGVRATIMMMYTVM